MFFLYEFTYLKLKETIFEGVPQAIVTLLSIVDPQYRTVLFQDTNDFLLICISFLFSFSMIVMTISQIDSESFATSDYSGLKKGTFFRFCFRFFEINIFLSLWVFLFYISWVLCFTWVVFQILFYTFLYVNNSKPKLIEYETDIKSSMIKKVFFIDTFDKQSNKFHNNVNFDRSFLFHNDFTNIILSLLLFPTLFKHSPKNTDITFWSLFYTKLNFIPYFSFFYSNNNFGQILNNYLHISEENRIMVGCHFVKQIYIFRFSIAFFMYVSGIVFLFILNKQNSVIILIVISIWLICNFLLFWLVFKIINNDFSNKFKAFGAFNATNAIQTQNVMMAKELFFLGEPHDIVMNDVANPRTLGFFYINEVSPNLKLVEEGLNIRILANINEQDSM